MQEAFALTAFLVTLASYLAFALGAAEARPIASEIIRHPGSTLSIKEDLGAALPLAISCDQSLDPVVHDPWLSSPAPRVAGRVAYTWTSGSPGEGGPTESFRRPAMVVEVCEDPRVLKRADELPAHLADPLADDVLRRYRSYASELALLRVEDADQQA